MKRVKPTHVGIAGFMFAVMTLAPGFFALGSRRAGLASLAALGMAFFAVMVLGVAFARVARKNAAQNVSEPSTAAPAVAAPAPTIPSVVVADRQANGRFAGKGKADAEVA